MNSSLAVNIGLMYAILIGVNLPAPLLGLSFGEETERTRLWFEPPGYVIPLAWFVLFTLLGGARYVLVRNGTSGVIPGLILALAVLCASYAYYTLGLAKLTGVSSLWYGLGGNLVVIAVALGVAYRVGSVSVSAGLLVVPVAIWTAYASAIVVGEMRVQGLL